MHEDGVSIEPDSPRTIEPLIYRLSEENDTPSRPQVPPARGKKFQRLVTVVKGLEEEDQVAFGSRVFQKGRTNYIQGNTP